VIQNERLHFLHFIQCPLSIEVRGDVDSRWILGCLIGFQRGEHYVGGDGRVSELYGNWCLNFPLEDATALYWVVDFL
jgi:hypothetical protein